MNTAFFVAMLEIIASWCAVIFVTTGVGLLGWKVLRFPHRLTIDSLILSFWLGFGLIVTALQLVHFFFPISPALPLLVTAIGLGGYAINFRKLRSLFKTFKADRRCLVMIPLAVVIAFMAQRANGPLFDYNAGYYQLQIIEWYKHYPVVPGLGNLFGCLSYNQAYYFFAALLDVCYGFPPCESITNGVFVMMMLLQIALWCSRYSTANSTTRITIAFHLVFFVVAFYEAIGPNVKAVATEIASTALSLVVANELIKVLLRRMSLRSVRSELFLIVFFCALLVTIKVGNIFYAFNASLIALWMARSIVFSPLPLRQLVMIGLLIVPWMIHGIIMNGCLLYPLSFTALPLDWAVPKESIQSCANWIYGFARCPDIHWTRVQPGWGWLPDWFLYVCYIYPINTMVPWSIALGSAPIVLAFRKRFDSRILYVLWAAALSYFCSMWLAPDTRYCVGTVWISAAILAALAAEVRGFTRGKALGFFAFACVALAISSPRFGQCVGFSQTYMLVKPLMREFTTRSGLRVLVPASSDRGYRAFPSTPFPNPYLRLREKGKIESGFVSDIRGNGVGVEP